MTLPLHGTNAKSLQCGKDPSEGHDVHIDGSLRLPTKLTDAVMEIDTLICFHCDKKLTLVVDLLWVEEAK